MDVSECRSCGAQIVWAQMLQSTKPIPLDPEPVERGNLEVVAHVGSVPVVRLVPLAERHPGLFRTHFATCRDASDWRRRR
jgi:hypothetical protein